MSNEDIWFNNIPILFEPSKLLSIIPEKNMSMGGKINSLTRFVLYLSIVLTIVKQNYLYLYILVVPVIISYVIYIFFNNSKEFFVEKKNDIKINNQTQELDLNKVMEDALQNECQLPTNDNPVMNVLPTDNFQQRLPACNISDQYISDMVTKEITDTDREKLYNDTTSIFNSRINERPFYTMPNNSVPNDQGTFAKWLYSTPVSCAIGDTSTLKQVRTCSYNHKNMNELKGEICSHKE